MALIRQTFPRLDGDMCTMHNIIMPIPSIDLLRRVLKDPADAARLSDALHAAGRLDQAIDLTAQDGASSLLSELMALRAALQEDADPGLKAARLRTAAGALDDRGDRLFAQAAEFFGKAAWRRARGETALADGFQRRAEAAEACGERLYARAAEHRQDAAACEGRLLRAAALAAIAV